MSGIVLLPVSMLAAPSGGDAGVAVGGRGAAVGTTGVAVGGACVGLGNGGDGGSVALSSGEAAIGGVETLVAAVAGAAVAVDMLGTRVEAGAGAPEEADGESVIAGWSGAAGPTGALTIGVAAVAGEPACAPAGPSAGWPPGVAAGVVVVAA